MSDATTPQGPPAIFTPGPPVTTPPSPTAPVEPAGPAGPEHPVGSLVLTPNGLGVVVGNEEREVAPDSFVQYPRVALFAGVLDPIDPSQIAPVD